MIKRIVSVTSMYGMVSLISLMIRQNILPTPAEALGFSVFGLANILAIFNGSGSMAIIFDGILGFIINYVLETPVHIVTYFVTGLYYERGECPPLGSILYFIFYFTHIMLLTFICWLKFNLWAVLITLIMYTVAHVFVKLKLIT